MSDLRRCLIEKIVADMSANPNSVGEALRALSFVGSYGCYSTFDLVDGFQPVAPTRGLFTAMWGRPPEDSDDIAELKRIQAYRHDGWRLLVAWHWDGDGHLYFDAPELGFAVSNTDCKCEDYWTIAAPCAGSIWTAPPIEVVAA